MPTVTFQIRIYDETKTLEQQDGADTDNTAYVHVAENQHFIETRLPANEYTGGAAGKAVAVEKRRLAYGYADNLELQSTVLSNELSGDGVIELVIFDEQCTSNADAERRAVAELARMANLKGSFSFTTFENVNIGDNVRLVDEVDGIDITWPIQEITFDVENKQLKRMCRCSPFIDLNPFQKAKLAYRKTLQPKPRGSVAIPAL